MDLNYVGLEISQLSVLKEFVPKLPSSIATIINGHLENLENSSDAGKIESVKEVIACLRTKNPDQFDEFIGWVAFSVAISLVKNQKLLMDKCGLLTHVFNSGIYIDQWNTDLIKMSIVAETIWKVCASKPDNIREVVFTICNSSQFTLVTSILLVAAAMNAITPNDDELKSDSFYMYELSKVLDILNELNSIDEKSKRFNKLYQLLALYSSYQSLVYLRKPKFDSITSLQKYFTASKSDLLAMQEFLKRLCVELNILMRKHQQVEYFALTDLIEFDILPGLEQLIENSQ